jgi:heavy metal efflux system protein
VRGRDLGSTVKEAIRRVNQKVKLPPGYYLQLGGEYESAKRANARLTVIVQ